MIAIDRRLGALALILAASLLAPSAATAESALRFQRDLIRAEAGSDGILVVPLDAQVFAATRDGFPDVRILDDRGTEVPFAVERGVRARTAPVREPVPARVDELRVVEGEALEVTATLADDAPEPAGATVVTPLTDFERRVRVFGSPDGREWTPLANDGRLFDYSRHMDVRSLDVAFPARGFRRFKLVIEREADELRSPFYELGRSRIEGDRERRTEVETILRRPFRIDRIAFWRDVERTTGEEPTTATVRLPAPKVTVDREDRTTRIDVDAGRLPLSRLVVRTPSRNFHRPARVLAAFEEGQGRDARWAEIGRGTLSRYDLDGFHREELAVSFPERRAGRLRIVVEDGDNPPIEVEGVDGDAGEYRLAFLGTPGRRYRLAYGSDELQTPHYDAEAVLAALGPDHRREAVGLGPQGAETEYRAPVGRPAKADPTVYLTLALVLMTAVLAWALVQAVRRVDKLPRDEFDD